MKNTLLLAAFASVSLCAQDLALRDEMLHAAAAPRPASEAGASSPGASLVREAGVRPGEGAWYKDCRVWSTLLLVAAHTLDTASSWNGIEANPVLGAGSRFGARATAVKFSFVGGYLALQHLVIRRTPESKRTFCGANYAGAAAIGAVAGRNFTVAR